MSRSRSKENTTPSYPHIEYSMTNVGRRSALSYYVVDLPKYLLHLL